MNNAALFAAVRNNLKISAGDPTYTDAIIAAGANWAEKDLGMRLAVPYLDEIIKTLTGVLCPGGIFNPAPQTIRVYPTIDSYLAQNPNNSTNYGLSNTMTIVPGSGEFGSYGKKALLYFNFSNYSNTLNLSDAGLYVYPSGKITLSGATAKPLNKLWTETGVTGEKYDGVTTWGSAGATGANDLINANLINTVPSFSLAVYNKITLSTTILLRLFGAVPIYTNYGIIIEGTGLASTSLDFYSRHTGFPPYIEFTTAQATFMNVLGSIRSGIVGVKTGSGYWAKRITDRTVLNNSQMNPSTYDPLFDIQNNAIRIYSGATAESTCDIEYKEVPPTIVEGGADPTLNEGLHDLMVMGTEWYARATAPTNDPAAIAATAQKYNGTIAELNKKVGA
jgi:hypothetical protein